MKKLLLFTLLLTALVQVPSLCSTPELVLQAGHRGHISDLAYSRDGKVLVSASRGLNATDEFGQIKLWNAHSGSLIRDFYPTSDALFGVNSVSLSPDARLLASANYRNHVALWDMTAGKVKKRLPCGQKRPVCAVAFVNGGRWLLGVVGASRPTGELLLWDVATGQLKKSFSTNVNNPPGEMDLNGRQALSLARDGSLLAFRSPRGVEIWNTTKWTRQRVIGSAVIGNAYGSIALSPNGRILAESNESREVVEFYDTISGRSVRRIPISNGWVQSMTFVANGKTLIGGLYGGGSTGLTRWWEVASGRTLRTIRPSTGLPKSKHKDDNGEDMEGDVQVLTPSPDDQRIALGTAFLSAIIQQRSITTGALRVVSAGLNSAVCDVLGLAFSADGKTLAVTQNDGTIRLWSLPPNGEIATLQGTYDQSGANHDEVGDVTAVAFLEGGKRFVTLGGRNFSISWWSANKAKPDGVTPIDYPVALAVSPSGLTACLTQRNSEEAKVRVWDRSGMKRGEWLTGMSEFRQASTIAFTPDGLLVLASSFYDKSPNAKNRHRSVYARLQFFDVTKSVIEARVSTLDVLEGDAPDTLQFSADGAYALLHTNIQRLYLVERATGNVLWKVDDHLGAVFSPDGKTVFCRPQERLIVARDTLSGKVLWRRDSFVGTRNEDDLTDDKTAWVSISPDGKTLAGKGDDGSVRLWNANDGHLMQSLLIMPTTPQQNFSPEWLAWKPDGEFGASKGASPFVRWRVGNRLFAIPPRTR